jgi:hypothetical protein
LCSSSLPSCKAAAWQLSSAARCRWCLGRAEALRLVPSECAAIYNA